MIDTPSIAPTIFFVSKEVQYDLVITYLLITYFWIQHSCTLVPESVLTKHFNKYPAYNVPA